MATLFNPFFQAIDGNGNPISGAKLYFYRTGTSTLQDTYSQSDLAPAHVNINPVVADSNGRFGPIYLATSFDYKAILKDASDVAIQTIDPVFAAGSQGRAAVNDASYAAQIGDRTIAYTAITAARTVSLPAASAFTAGDQLLIVDESGQASSTATISIAPDGTDTINGSNTTQVVIAAAYGSAMLESDGNTKWTLLRTTDGRRAVADAATTVTARDSLISYTSLSSARIVSLPAATAFPAGKRLVIADESGSASATVTISAAPNGTNKLGGSNTTQALITYPYGVVELVSNGVDSWDILTSKTTGGTWTPADNSGASLTFTGAAGHWQKIGNLIFAWFTLTFPSTANGSTVSISGLPATVANNDQSIVASVVHNTGGANMSYARVTKNTATFALFSKDAGQFTNSQMSTLTLSGMIVYPVT
jgi:hypothetical protein